MQVRGQRRKSASRGEKDGRTDRQTDRIVVDGTERLERGNLL